MTEIERLGTEYETTAATVKSRIAERLAKLRVLRQNGRILSDDAYILKSEINQLYREYNETVAIASYLKNYYSSNETLDNILFT